MKASNSSPRQSRRRAPAVAATMAPVAVIAASELPTATHTYFPAAALARAERVVEALKALDPSPSAWAIDDEAAERTLGYFRDQLAGKKSNDDEWAAVVEFCDTHKQSLDWILLGDPTDLISGAALRSKQAYWCRSAQRQAATDQGAGGPSLPWQQLLPRMKQLLPRPIV
jgi:hypothetical protein